MATTQDHIPIKDIQSDLVLLNDGSYAVVIETSAVNFDLLSENEQLAIISSFAGLLNSLSFPIQIVIRSKRLDISNYIELLVRAEKKQVNPLLKNMMERYRVFVETIIRENEVLDKQFYVVLNISSLELGVGADKEKKLQKALTLLSPRIDHIIRQLGRIGLTAEPLTTEELIKLYYDVYNENIALNDAQLAAQEVTKPPTPQPQEQAPPPPLQRTPIPVVPKPEAPPQQAPVQVAAKPQPQAPVTQLPPTQKPIYQQTRSNVPFVVEELPDEYSSV